MPTNTTNDINILREQYKDIKQYKTLDIALAATMMLKGKKLLFMEPVHKKDIFYFVFEDTEDREQMVLLYSTNSESLQVTPNAFRSTIRYLKEMMRNGTH